MLQRNSFNYAIGLDVNRFIRQLNPRQTFFISTQFFYKHVFDSPGDLILPVPVRNIGVDRRLPLIGTRNAQNPVLGFGCPFNAPPGTPPDAVERRLAAAHPCKLQPRFIHIGDDQFLHTLLITTSYRGGRLVPYFGFFYDWLGGPCGSRAWRSCAIPSASSSTTRASSRRSGRGSFGAPRPRQRAVPGRVRVLDLSPRERAVPRAIRSHRR